MNYFIYEINALHLKIEVNNKLFYTLNLNKKHEIKIKKFKFKS
jgi:hypothetical protein